MPHTPIRQLNVARASQNALQVQNLEDQREFNALRKQGLQAGLTRQNKLAGFGASFGAAETPAARQGVADKAVAAGEFDVAKQLQGIIDSGDERALAAVTEKASKTANVVKFLDAQPADQRAAAYEIVLPALREAAPESQLPDVYSEEVLQNIKASVAEFDPILPDELKIAKTKKALDTRTNQLVFATEQQIEESGGALAPVPSGMKFEVGADRSVSLVTGELAGLVGGGAESLTTPVVTDLQKRQLVATEQLTRVRDIEAAFEPRFLELATKFNNAFLEGKEKLGFPLTPGDQQNLRDFSTFKRRTIDNINKLLNELSGAAVSPQEAIRLRSSMPDVGSGLFDGDSPTVFKAKMDDVTRSLKLAMARFSFAQKSGLDASSFAAQQPLATVPDLIEREGARIQQEIQAAQPDLPPDQLLVQVKAGLQQLFGQ